jgi:hypothetical protein
MQTYKKSLLAIGLIMVLSMLFQCFLQEDPVEPKDKKHCNPNNGQCESRFFAGTPFANLDDFIAHIEVFKSVQIETFNDDINGQELFGIELQAMAQSTEVKSISGQVKPLAVSDSLMLDFISFYVDQQEFSVICIYDFLEKKNMSDLESYTIKSGILLAKYVFSKPKDTWVYSGITEVYIYDYISEVVEGSRIITSISNPEEVTSLTVLPTNSISSFPLTTAAIQAAISRIYSNPGLLYLRLRGASSIIVQVHNYTHKKLTPEELQKLTCTSWSTIAHINVVIYLRPRGDGSLKDSLDMTKDLLSKAVLKKQYGSGVPGHEIANWHVRLVKKDDGRICFQVNEGRWRKINWKKLPSYKYPAELITEFSNEGNSMVCKEYCSPPREFVRKIPWTGPFAFTVPERDLDRIAQEIGNENNYHEPAPGFERTWYETYINPLTDTIASALNDLGNIQWASSDIYSLIDPQPISDADLIAGQNSILAQRGKIYIPPIILGTIPVTGAIVVPAPMPVPIAIP